ncbi:hypothetical protein KIPB_002693 [Kipferlia bialata]|uniref:Uncharacterized protein n=1 Tax=Kipferlia bialata TaxID=797122 RepID=A0A9K3CR46_9EUKA|nr:hypothetical protein KIPB_002693 [Kipferlia bialata]|eukprot:g2693.t1
MPVGFEKPPRRVYNLIKVRPLADSSHVSTLTCSDTEVTIRDPSEEAADNTRGFDKVWVTMKQGVYFSDKFNVVSSDGDVSLRMDSTGPVFKVLISYTPSSLHSFSCHVDFSTEHQKRSVQVTANKSRTTDRQERERGVLGLPSVPVNRRLARRVPTRRAYGTKYSGTTARSTSGRSTSRSSGGSMSLRRPRSHVRAASVERGSRSRDGDRPRLERKGSVGLGETLQARPYRAKARPLTPQARSLGGSAKIISPSPSDRDVPFSANSITASQRMSLADRPREGAVAGLRVDVKAVGACIRVPGAAVPAPVDLAALEEGSDSDEGSWGSSDSEAPGVSLSLGAPKAEGLDLASRLRMGAVAIPTPGPSLSLPPTGSDDEDSDFGSEESDDGARPALSLALGGPTSAGLKAQGEEDEDEDWGDEEDWGEESDTHTEASGQGSLLSPPNTAAFQLSASYAAQMALSVEFHNRTLAHFGMGVDGRTELGAREANDCVKQLAGRKMS